MTDASPRHAPSDASAGAPSRRAPLVIVAVMVAVLAGWSALRWNQPIGSSGRVSPPGPRRPAVEVAVNSTPLAPVDRCDDRFVAHRLDHTTRPIREPAPLYDSNGTGVAADDLDGDGRPDIVLANLEGPNTILWNDGDWTFTTEEMADRAARAVNLVDVDGDGRLDIVTTHRASGIALFLNRGDRRFERQALSGVGAPAYSMAWADIDGDGYLDLAAGSYDAELDQVLRSGFLFSDGAGIYLYRRIAGSTDADPADPGQDRAIAFEAERLAEKSQALTTSFVDLDHDGDPELLVGNDFAMHDGTWRNDDGRLVPIEPFEQYTAHTMSMETGDVDNDGTEELFASDMAPADQSTESMAAWTPVLDTMDELDNLGDPQRIHNTLQVATAQTPPGEDRPEDEDLTVHYREMAGDAGVDATGWAWSARFGDLDNDTDLDLHVVNGMIAAETLHYLDGAELIEPNQVMVNNGRGRFTTVDWGLGDTASGRGSILVDLDGDGRLDVVVNNLSSPAMAFENTLCSEGNSPAGGTADAVEYRLRQPGTGNTHAIGAVVTLVDETNHQRLTRRIASGGGYLSGKPSTLHFGLGPKANGPGTGGEGDLAVDRVEVLWPDGAITILDPPTPGTAYTITRNGDPD